MKVWIRRHPWLILTTYLAGLAGGVWFAWPAAAINVKVERAGGELVSVYLPMHKTRIVGWFLEGRPEQLEAGKFYKADFETGKISTTRKNVLRIKTRRGRARIRILRIVFLE